MTLHSRVGSLVLATIMVLGSTLVPALPAGAIAMSSNDVQAIRAASEPLLAELAKRGITPHDKEQP